jgi:transcriptional regulator with GAF, ATPase, and Fis domain
VARKIGRFELADGGTLFLDEIGELPLELQSKLLRVLEEGEFERVGSSIVHRANVRIIAASNRDLDAAAREGRFRADLYYRLLVFPIDLPPLRARKEDIPLLAWYVLDRLTATLGKRIERVPAPAMDRLLRYDWPGNVRELRNVLERAVILSPGPTLVLEPFGDEVRTAAIAVAEAGATRTLVDVERDHIRRALEQCDWRVRGPGNAAAQLGLNASTLYSRMKKLGIRRAASTPRRRKAG